MSFRRIEAPSIKELFLLQMEEMILSGELKAGERLPSERELADKMGISKTVVHEGIRELARIGFLDVASRKGVYVADYSTTGNLDTLFAIIKYRGGMLDHKMVISLLDARLYIECPAIRILAAGHTEADIERLEACVADAYRVMDKGSEKLAQALFVFRRAIVLSSGNCVTPLIMNAFFESSLTSWTDYCEFQGAFGTCEEIHDTAECIKTGNGERAVDILTDCIERYKAHVLECHVR